MNKNFFMKFIFYLIYYLFNYQYELSYIQRELQIGRDWKYKEDVP